MDGYLRVSGADSTPLRTLGIELFLFLLTCARPWGQGQESPACPGGAQPGVGMVHATLVRLSLPVCSHGASSPWGWWAAMQRPWSLALREAWGSSQTQAGVFAWAQGSSWRRWN